MGTRHLIAVQLGGEYRIAQYGQWDGYPTGQGTDVLGFLRTMDRPLFEQKLRAASFFSPEEITALWEDLKKRGLSEQWQKLYPHLSRDAGADILGMVQNGESGMRLRDSRTFAADSLFCEWGYVVDLDANRLEVFEGFNQTPLSADERFYGFDEEGRNREYEPIRKVKEWPLDALPSDEDFVATLEPPEKPESDDAVGQRSE